MMRVLVLGANGFVGRHVVRAFSSTGWAEVIAAGRQDVDACDERAVAAALQGVDAVVNCVAGDIVQNARALFAASAGVHVVYLSSMAVYGDATGRVDEGAPLLGNVGDYSAAKVQAEQLVHDRVTIFRPGCIYGGGSPQWTVRIAKLLEARRIGDLGEDGDGCSNLVHVSDVAQAVLAAVKGTQVGIFNLAMAKAPDWNEYFVRFGQAIGAVPVARIPKWRLKVETKVLAVPLKIAEKAGSGGVPVISPSLARLWRQDIRLDAGRAERELGVEWTSLEDGLAEAARSRNG